MNIGVIPARLGSTRFPGKILASLAGKPMVMHVYERAKQAARLDDVLIAVDDDQVKTILKRFGANVVMTSADHESGTDRVAEAVAGIEADIVVNIQADEPMLEPAVIDALIAVFDDKNVNMATVVSRDLSTRDILNPNIVKVFLDHRMHAVDFMREMPDNIIGGCYRHIGIYAFRKDFLIQFTKLKPSESEMRHHLEQLRALDNGLLVHAILTDYVICGVDTPEDLDEVAGILDKLELSVTG
ncbi:MAG: 3-deoxy-manno-octulosonate cytidylyltransferase [Candidatus Marinimicrobia bacterium]|nr:3-deoxy-manno-octulosonate cytidylyltransferase [Candidatus Neomarinimicrobiota bacterium]